MLGSCFFNISKIYICYLKSFDKCIHWYGVCPHHHSIFITQEAPSCPSIQAPTTPIALGDSCSHFCVHSLILPVLELHIIMASIAQIMFLNSSMLLTCTSSVLFLSDITLFKYSVLILLLYSFFFQFGAIMNKAAMVIFIQVFI